MMIMTSIFSPPVGRGGIKKPIETRKIRTFWDDAVGDWIRPTSLGLGNFGKAAVAALLACVAMLFFACDARAQVDWTDDAVQGTDGNVAEGINTETSDTDDITVMITDAGVINGTGTSAEGFAFMGDGNGAIGAPDDGAIALTGNSVTEYRNGHGGGHRHHRRHYRRRHWHHNHWQWD